MFKVFQPITSTSFLEKMENERVGKALIEKTGLSASKMLVSFRLILPPISNPMGWLIEGNAISAHNLHDILLFLKYAWVHSEYEKSKHVNSLRYSVFQEITSFEKDLLYEEERRKLDKTTELLKNRELEAKKSVEKLIQSQSQIKEQKKDLKYIQKELKAKLLKKKNISIRNSRSASNPRGCEEFNECLEKLYTNNAGKRSSELWSFIGEERDGKGIYIENNKIIHEECSCGPYGKSTFYRRIKEIKETLGKIPASDAK